VAQRRPRCCSRHHAHAYGGELPAGPWPVEHPIFTTAPGAAGSFNIVAASTICASSTECGQPGAFEQGDRAST